MAVVINNGVANATGTFTAVGETEVIASGVFGANRVLVEVRGSATTEYAPVYTFNVVGGVKLGTAAGSTVRVTVVGPDAASAIDVTCN
jgi:hypothetical protein